MKRLFAAIRRRFVHRHTRRAPAAYRVRWWTCDMADGFRELPQYDLESQRWKPPESDE